MEVIVSSFHSPEHALRFGESEQSMKASGSFPVRDSPAGGDGGDNRRSGIWIAMLM